MRSGKISEKYLKLILNLNLNLKILYQNVRILLKCTIM